MSAIETLLQAPVLNQSKSRQNCSFLLTCTERHLLHAIDVDHNGNNPYTIFISILMDSLRTNMIHTWLYLVLSVLKILAISGTSGSSGLGSQRREQTDKRRICRGKRKKC